MALFIESEMALFSECSLECASKTARHRRHCQRSDLSTATRFRGNVRAQLELERSLIIERVRAGVRNARAKGTRLGRPPVFTNTSKLLELRQRGYTWAQITIATGVSKGTAQRALASLPTTNR
jgi:DNA invertase Pin-like site-specific DNA recombinase